MVKEEMPTPCPPDFYFDRVVSGCSPCSNVCGESGHNKVDCETHCNDYIQQMSTLHSVSPKLYPQSPVGFQMHIWVVVAVASVILATVTIAVVAVILWKIRKARALARSSEACQGLMATGPVFYPNSSPRHTERWQPAEQPTTLPLFRSISSRCFTLALNGRCAVEESSKHSLNLLEDDYVSFEARPLEAGLGQVSNGSEYSLKSDASLASHAFELAKRETKVDTVLESARLPRNQSLTSSVSNLLQMFGWLNKTPWVMEYSDGLDGLRIGVEGIEKTRAEHEIRSKGHRLHNFHFFVTTTPTKGRYIPCPKAGGEATPLKHLRPGSIIFSPAMEPDPETKQTQAGNAVYSGSLQGLTSEPLGMTVGHLFEAEGIKATVDGIGDIGECRFKANLVKHRLMGQMTADLALLRLHHPSENVIVDSTGALRNIRLFKNDIYPGLKVAIRHRNGSYSQGIVTETLFTFKKCGLLNTLRIVRSENDQQKITSEGDSGSLVLSCQALADGAVGVCGMVIGYWENDDGSKSHTVATRLWNILETLTSSSSNVEFNPASKGNCCSPPADSGFYSFAH